MTHLAEIRVSEPKNNSRTIRAFFCFCFCCFLLLFLLLFLFLVLFCLCFYYKCKGISFISLVHLLENSGLMRPDNKYAYLMISVRYLNRVRSVHGLSTEPYMNWPSPTLNKLTTSKVVMICRVDSSDNAALTSRCKKVIFCFYSEVNQVARRAFLANDSVVLLYATSMFACINDTASKAASASQRPAYDAFLGLHTFHANRPTFFH